MATLISQYTLYSETESINDPEFFHVETIRSRARAFNWNIGIHSHPKLFQLIFIASGDATVILDGQQQHVQGPYLVSVPSSAVHGFVFEQDTTGYVVTVSNLVFEQTGLKQDLPNYDQFCETAQTCALDIQSLDHIPICQAFDQIYLEYQQDHLAKRAVFLWTFFGILARMARQLPSCHPPTQLTAAEEKFGEVKQLIEQHYREQRPIAELAELLNLSTLTLNRLCHKVAGKSFKELINSRLLLEAQRMLIYSTAPISSIAYEVGFSDPAYFTRFFTKWVGLSPSEFRNRRQQNS